MTILPEIIARGQQFGLERQDEMLRTFSGREIAMQQRPAFWSFRIPVLPRSNAEAKKWRAALAELSSYTNSFEASPLGYTGTAYAVNGGAGLFVSGGGQLGREIDYHNADVSQVVFKVGEYFSVNGELKIVTAESSSDSGGLGSVQFEPALRNPVPSNDPIVIMNPTATFRLATPMGGWALSPNRLHSFTLNAVETY